MCQWSSSATYGDSDRRSTEEAGPEQEAPSLFQHWLSSAVEHVMGEPTPGLSPEAIDFSTMNFINFWAKILEILASRVCVRVLQSLWTVNPFPPARAKFLLTPSPLEGEVFLNPFPPGGGRWGWGGQPRNLTPHLNPPPSRGEENTWRSCRRCKTLMRTLASKELTVAMVCQFSR